MTTTTPKSKAEIINNMVSVLGSMEALNEDLKALKDEAKELQYDPVILTQVAKSILKDKQSELQERSEAILELLQEVK